MDRIHILLHGNHRVEQWLQSLTLEKGLVLQHALTVELQQLFGRHVGPSYVLRSCLGLAYNSFEQVVDTFVVVLDQPTRPSLSINGRWLFPVFLLSLFNYSLQLQRKIIFEVLLRQLR